MTNVKLLKSKMALIGVSNFTTWLSETLEISMSSASAKINGEAPFKQSEIVILTVKLGLTGDEVKEIFVDGVN